MRDEMAEVIALQPRFSARSTPEMQRRGELIRRRIPAELAVASGRIARAMGRFGADLAIEGKDGKGSRTHVPWVRFHSRAMSPSAQNGWYAVYLFEATGQGVYLALAHGAATYSEGQYQARPAEQMEGLVAWGRRVLGPAAAEETGWHRSMQLNGKALAGAYERSALCARWYPADGLPGDEVFLSDAVRMAGHLGALYAAEAAGRMPGAVPPERREVEMAAAGRLVGASARPALQAQARAMARLHLRRDGWAVQDVSGFRPYDLHATRGGEALVVLVKGTTGRGEELVLGQAELRALRSAHPANALVIVSGMGMPEGEDGGLPGGAVRVVSPWRIEEGALEPLAFLCRPGPGD